MQDLIFDYLNVSRLGPEGVEVGIAKKYEYLLFAYFKNIDSTKCTSEENASV